MLIGHYTEVKAKAPTMPGALATIRWLITKKQGARHFAMRVIEIAESRGAIPLHRHDYEHGIFVLEGAGRVFGPGGGQEFAPGDFIYIGPDEEHGFENTGNTSLRFICVIPNPA